VRVGVLYPSIEMDTDRGAVKAFIEAVDDLGFDHLLAWEHIFSHDPSQFDWVAPNPYTYEDPFPEPFVLFGFAAAIAPRLEYVTNVLVLPQRQTELVAKQAAQVDLFTEGKFRLGVGLGWNKVEYEMLGRSFATRGRRITEQVEVLRKLWAAPLVDYEGEHHRAYGVGINPLPARRSIPIWMGGMTDAAVRRAAHVADGWLTYVPIDEGGWEASFERLFGWLEEAGRDPREFGIEGRVYTHEGGPDEWHADAEAWRERGATHIHVNTMDNGLVSVDEHIERLEAVAAAVR
jgi:probable F420-dependent oxidoreductase